MFDWDVVEVVQDKQARTTRGSRAAVRVAVSRGGPPRLSYTCGFVDSRGVFRIVVHLDHNHAEAFADLLDLVISVGEKVVDSLGEPSSVALSRAFRERLGEVQSRA